MDYQNTSTVFWGMMNKYKPIAVMTTSRNKPDNDWVLEIGAKNLARADWALLPFNNGRRPFIGGGASDPASAASLPNAGLTPNPNNTNPPDATRNADPTTNDEMGRKLTDDAKAIQQLIMDQLNSTFAPAALFAKRDTEFQGVGFDNYVSGFAGYHALWYNAWSNSSKAGWHTHVGSNITVANASAAIKLQLEVLIEWLIDN